MKLLRGQADIGISTGHTNQHAPSHHNQPHFLRVIASDRWRCGIALRLLCTSAEIFSSFPALPPSPLVLPLMLTWRCHLSFDKLLIRCNSHFSFFFFPQPFMERQVSSSLLQRFFMAAFVLFHCNTISTIFR